MRWRAFVWPLVLLILATTLYIGARRRRDFVDFLVYRTAAERAIHGEPLYRETDGHYQYKYWPAFALAMAPFAVIDPEVARGFWYALSVALLVIFLRRSIAELPGRRLTVSTIAAWTAVLLAKSIIQELVNGQTNLLLGWLLLAGAAAAVREQRIAAGVCVGVAMFVKPYAAIFVPWLAAVAGVPAIAAFATVVAALLAAPAAVYGWRGNLALLHDWYRTVSTTTAPNLLFPENISLASMWAKWIGPGPLASTLTIVTSVVLASIAVRLWMQRRRTPAPAYLEIAFLLLLIPLWSPQGWDYVLLVAAPAFVCLVDRFRDLSKAFRFVAGGGFVLTSLTIFDLLGRHLYERLTGWSVVTVGALALAAALAHLRRRGLA